MATRNTENLFSQKSRGARGAVIKWDGLLADDDGQWRLLAHYRDKVVHVYGTFNGARVILEGTNEDANSITPSTYVPLRDRDTEPGQDSQLNFNEAGIKHVRENPLYLRPQVIGGDGSTSLTVLMVCRH